MLPHYRHEPSSHNTLTYLSKDSIPYNSMDRKVDPHRRPSSSGPPSPSLLNNHPPPKRKLHFLRQPLHLRHNRGVLPPHLTVNQILGSWLAAFLGILTVSAIHYNAPLFIHHAVPGVVASLGATAVLIYGVIESPLAQPRCVIGGQCFSAICGVTIHKIAVGIQQHWNLPPFTDAGAEPILQMFECAFAVSLSVVVMHITRTTHPPGGATALVAVMGPESIWELGYLYVVVPILLGCVLLVAVAVIVNRCCGRWYPLYWFAPAKVRGSAAGRKVSVGAGDMGKRSSIVPAPVKPGKDIETEKNGGGDGRGGEEAGRIVEVEVIGDVIEETREGDGGWWDGMEKGEVEEIDESTSAQLPAIEELKAVNANAGLEGEGKGVNFRDVKAGT
ncbi:hypothetical protein HDV00_009573 [Rhizophlyctis rosea]|nr:hypothetical protein HDV00_009573 [Rhizophlyctis rosea]